MLSIWIILIIYALIGWEEECHWSVYERKDFLYVCRYWKGKRRMDWRYRKVHVLHELTHKSTIFIHHIHPIHTYTQYLIHTHTIYSNICTFIHMYIHINTYFHIFYAPDPLCSHRKLLLRKNITATIPRAKTIDWLMKYILKKNCQPFYVQHSIYIHSFIHIPHIYIYSH